VKNEAELFPLKETVMPKAGMGLTAASVSNIINYGGRLLWGRGRGEFKERF